MYDFHVHSNFSSDCKYSMEGMIKSALKKKAKTIAFTDHVDYEYGREKIDFVFMLEDYLKEIKKLKNNYKGQIEILCGIELGMQPHLTEKAYNITNRDEFDFVLMSLHMVNGYDLTEEDFYKEKLPAKMYEEYCEDLMDILNNFDNFDVVGHLDIIERYNRCIGVPSKIDDYKEILIDVLKKIIDMGKGIEVNTSGMRYGLDFFHPNEEILKLYYQLGGQIITIGSDAHNPKDVCDKYKQAIDLLKNIGFKYISVFRNRKKHMVKI